MNSDNATCLCMTIGINRLVKSNWIIMFGFMLNWAQNMLFWTNKAQNLTSWAQWPSQGTNQIQTQMAHVNFINIGVPNHFGVQTREFSNHLIFSKLTLLEEQSLLNVINFLPKLQFQEHSHNALPKRSMCTRSKDQHTIG